MKRALITGITGQDGSYLAELLLEKEYEVHGIIRRSSTFNTQRISSIYSDPHNKSNNLTLHYGDLVDASNISRLIEKIKPDEIYNLAAQSHVGVSFDMPDYTGEVDALGTLRILDAVREIKLDAKVYQASTSELYGKVQETPQTETTPFYPMSPYGVAKLYAYWIMRNYREAYNIFACNGILFNHESERRGKRFVTRKITIAVAKIMAGLQEKLYLGNLEAKRDWGYAPEYVEAMYLMMQHDTPMDLVIATGETHTVKEFVEKAFASRPAYLGGMEIVWEGEGVNERGIDKNTGKVIVEVDPKYFRPTEVEILMGDPSKAKEELGWEPKVKFEELVTIMTTSDIAKLTTEGEIGLDYL